MLAALFESLIRPISGSLGVRLRRFYYQRRLRSCGHRLVVSEGVYLDNPQNIELGNDVWLDRGSKIIAGKIQAKNIKRLNVDDQKEGHVVIGDNTHIGIDSIIQGHGGVVIGSKFTSSAGLKLYSLSNDVGLSKYGTHSMESSEKFYVMNTICIGKNVWLGLNVCVLAGNIENDVFIKPNSVVVGDIASNSIAEGNPASVVKPRFK